MFGGVQFNTGSSSSTDLSQLLQFYNESGNPEITEQWMNLYRAQKTDNQQTSVQDSKSNTQQQILNSKFLKILNINYHHISRDKKTDIFQNIFFIFLGF